MPRSSCRYAHFHGRDNRTSRAEPAQPGKFTSSGRIIASFVLAWLLSAVAVQAATVTASWNANSEPDLAGYKLSYGIVSGVYTTTIDVGNVTSTPVTGLTSGQTY